MAQNCSIIESMRPCLAVKISTSCITASRSLPFEEGNEERNLASSLLRMFPLWRSKAESLRLTCSWRRFSSSPYKVLQCERVMDWNKTSTLSKIVCRIETSQRTHQSPLKITIRTVQQQDKVFLDPR